MMLNAIMRLIVGKGVIEFMEKYKDCDLEGIEVHGRGAITRRMVK